MNPVIGGEALVIFVGTTGLKSGEMLMKRRREDGGKAGKKWVGY